MPKKKVDLQSVKVAILVAVIVGVVSQSSLTAVKTEFYTVSWLLAAILVAISRKEELFIVDM